MGAFIASFYNNAFYGTLRGMLVQTLATGAGLIAPVIISKSTITLWPKCGRFTPYCFGPGFSCLLHRYGREGADDIA